MVICSAEIKGREKVCSFLEELKRTYKNYEIIAITHLGFRCYNVFYEVGGKEKEEKG